MAESITKSLNNDPDKTLETTETGPNDKQSADTIAAKKVLEPQSPIIWTPRFIIRFSLTLVVALSTASLLTQGWENHYYTPDLVLLSETLLVLYAWIVTIFRARTTWLRIGAIFGGLWMLIAGVNVVIDWITGSTVATTNQPVIAYLNAAINIAMLGSYICLSINRTPIRRWDTRFFSIAPILSCCIVVVAYFMIPADTRSLTSLESITAAIALYLSIFVWWLRPSCWRTQPGPAILFTIAPIIQLLLSIPQAFNGGDNFFLLQVSLFFTLFGIMRCLQGDMRLAKGL